MVTHGDVNHGGFRHVTIGMVTQGGSSAAHREDKIGHHGQEDAEDEQRGDQEQPEAERVVTRMKLFAVTVELLLEWLARPAVRRSPLEADIAQRGADLELERLG